MKAYKTNMVLGVVAVWVVFILQLLATKYTWYWIFPWFDVLMHILGGVAVGFILLAIVSKYLPMRTWYAVCLVILGALFVGYVWEVNEFILEKYTGADLQPSIADTLADLSFDMLGALLASLFAQLLQVRKS